MPATNGANVLTIGTKRAMIIVLGPYLSKKAWERRLQYNLREESYL